MDKRDFKKLLILVVLFIAVISSYVGYLVWEDHIQIKDMIPQKDITFYRGTGNYNYTAHIDEINHLNTWDIKAGKDRVLNNIAENSSNVDNLNKFKQAVDNLFDKKMNLVIYVLGIVFSILALIVLRDKEKSYVYGFAKGMLVAMLMMLIYKIISSVTDYYEITNDIDFYYNYIQLK